MGAAVTAIISLAALAWWGFFVLAAPRGEATLPARQAFLSYLLVLVLWTVGPLAAWLLVSSPGVALPAALLGSLVFPTGCVLFVRAYRLWRLPRMADGAMIGGAVVLALASYFTNLAGRGSPNALALAILSLSHGLSLLGLAAWLWAHNWRRIKAGRKRIALPSAALAFLTVALQLTPMRGHGLEFVLAGVAIMLAAQIIFQRRLTPLPPPQRRSVGYAVLSLLAAALYALLAYGAHILMSIVGALFILAGGLMLSGVTLAFPELAESLSRWTEQRFLRSQPKARRPPEEEASESSPAMPELEPLVGTILERTISTLDIRWGIFVLWDPAAQELCAVAVRGLPEEIATARWQYGHPLTHWFLEGPSEASSQHLPYSQPATDLPALDTAWIVPVRLPTEPVGLFLYGPHNSGEPYNATEGSILNLLANETAAAVANARLFTQVARARREWVQTFDALSDGVFLHNREGRILRANRALAQLVGRPFDRIISQPWFEIIPVGPEPRQLCLATVSAGQGHRTAEYDLSFGPHRTLHITVSPLAEGNEFCVHIVRDVTQERALQLHLTQTEKLAAIGEMLSGAAHELNNPLTTIIGFSELLQDANVPDQVREDLQRIYRQAKRGSRIVQNLLTFARQSRLQMAEVDINALLEQTLEILETQLEDSAIEVILELDEQLPRTLADGERLQQVFLNLITNALQAMMETHGGGRLRLSTQTTLAGIQVAVQDNGPGIPPELLRRIFDPFFTTKGTGEGTGLGLSICYGICREHGGRIWVESALGYGATFYVELPVRHASAAEQAAVLAGRRILLVEDDEAIVTLLLRVLEPAGHQVWATANGEAGLQAVTEAMARKQTPDLIIADMKLPGMDGSQFYEQVQRKFPQLARRFLFISGDTTQAEIQNFLEANNLPSLSKPFGMQDIERAVNWTLAAR